jgi:hypothetical protein
MKRRRENRFFIFGVPQNWKDRQRAVQNLSHFGEFVQVKLSPRGIYLGVEGFNQAGFSIVIKQAS